MSMLILCTGKPQSPLEGSFSSAAFDAAFGCMIDSAAEAPAERKIAPGGRTVYIAEGGLSLSTAEQILEPCQLQVEPLLNEIPVRSFTDTEQQFSAEKWLKRHPLSEKLLTRGSRNPVRRSLTVQICSSVSWKTRAAIPFSLPTLCFFPNSSTGCVSITM